MARHEADREDLMREATALRNRAEFCLASSTDPIIAGFRNEGALSIYFAGDPAYHFDADGQLRRAFAGGFLYRTQGTTLARLQRKRDDQRSILERHDLSPDELQTFLAEVSRNLQTVVTDLAAGNCTLRQQIPSDAGVLLRLEPVLSGILRTGIRLAPRIK